MNELSDNRDFEEFLSKKYIGIHEAAFMITGWPKDCSLLFSERTIPLRSLKGWYKFLLPRNQNKFDPSQYGKNFESLFSIMTHAAARGTLEATFSYVCEGINWVVEPNHVIFWALSKGIFLPEELQKKHGVYLFDSKINKTSETWVKKKIIAQILLMEEPNEVTNKLKSDSLFAAWGINSADANLTAIVKAIESVRKNPGKKGVKKREPYVFEPISEIKRIDPDGTVRFHLPALQIALRTLLWAWVYRLGYNHLIGGMQYCSQTYESPVTEWYQTSGMAKLYLTDASPLLLYVLLEFCSDEWERICYHCELIEDNAYTCN